MKLILYILLALIPVLQSCQTKQIAKTVSVSKPTYDFAIINMNDIEIGDLLYKLKGVKLQEGQLFVDVEYSGGCVKPHIFSLVTDGMVRDAGVMKFALLHKTKDDKCKALLKENMTFDISSVLNLGSEKLKEIQINEYVLSLNGTDY